MAHEPFVGLIPDDRLYCPRYDMWVQVAPDGRLTLGASSFGLFLAGEIIAFTAKPRGASIEQGRGLGTVECRKTVLAVHAPVGFILEAGNDEAEEKPARINRDPYGSGWLAQGHALRWDDEKHVLIDGPAYRAHILAIEPAARFLSPDHG